MMTTVEGKEDKVMSAEPDRAHLLEGLYQDSFALMWRTRRDLDETFRSLALKPPEVLTLELLAQGSCYPKDLAEALNVAPPVVSALLRGLEARGLVGRTPDPADHRRVFLKLTEAGRETHEGASRAWRARQCKRLARLSPAQLRSLCELQRTLLEER